MITLTQNLLLYPSTCYVYILRKGEKAVLIDFGDGSVLDELKDLGITEVTAIFMTHHHRDQAQGLPVAVKAGIPIFVPDMERDLFSEVDWHWQARNIMNNYDVREDRFSLLESVPISGVLHDYERLNIADIDFEVIPTPGHTPGSISIATEIDGEKVCFVGDLIAGPGKLWSLSATQWTYNGAEGAAYTVLSLLQLKKRDHHRLLPSHGEVMNDPPLAIDLLIKELLALLNERGDHLNLLAKVEEPYQQITPHVYRNLTSVANSYVVISDNGKALIVDFGYDFVGGLAAGADRASRRPWLYTLPTLKEKLGVKSIDAVLPTHYHDDHVAGINLLAKIEGAQVWAPENFAEILKDPARFNLPCLWYDPIAVDVIQPLENVIEWEQCKITLYELSGHTRYAVVILLEVDGKRILFTGDEYQGDEGTIWNYVYQNRCEMQDYHTAANLYQELRPDIILSGHWAPLYVNENYYQIIKDRGIKLEEYHRRILPIERLNLGMEGFVARLMPYQGSVKAGETIEYDCEVTNPMEIAQVVKARLILPVGWKAEPADHIVVIEANSKQTVTFNVSMPKRQKPKRRLRIAVEISVGDHSFGQQAEALINIIT